MWLPGRRMMTKLSARTWTSRLLVIWVLITAAGASGQPAASTSSPTDAQQDSRFSELIRSADRYHESQACHLEAEALEKALQMLPPRHAQRRELARRLAAVCRSGMGHYARAERWLQTLADELRPLPQGIDALFDLADAYFNHGRLNEALSVYREILKRIVPPEPPYDVDDRCWKAWRGEDLCESPLGSDPLFPSDASVSGQVFRISNLAPKGSWEDIRRLLDENLRLRLMIRPGQEAEVWTSLRAEARKAISRLPDDAMRRLVAAYERRLAELAGGNDWRSAVEFRLSHPIPQLEGVLDAAIGDKLLDLGQPALASIYYGRAVQAAGQNAEPILLARELFSRIQSGETIPLDNVPEIRVGIGGQERTLRQWVEHWQPRISPAPLSKPVLDIGRGVMTRVPMLRATCPLLQWQARWRARNWDDVYPYLDEFVPCIAAGSPRRLLINMGDAIEAVDLTDGRIVWSFLPPEENPMPQPGQEFQARDAYVMCGKSKTAVVNGGRVFCHLLWGHHDTPRDAGALFALRESDGAMIWSSLYVPQLAGIQFAADPAVYRGVVVAVAWRPRSVMPMFFVVGMSAETGEVLWLNHLYSGGSMVAYDNEQFLDLPTACGPPVIADGVAYLTTGAGVVAAVDVLDGTTLWATAYPRARAINREEWAVRMATSRPPGVVAVFRDVVLFAPVDAHLLLAVERSTGRIRYMHRSVDLRAIAAADAERAYVVEGTTVRAVRPADGRTVWETQLVTSGLVGLPTLADRGLLCPTWETLYLLDPANGGILAERDWDRAQACGYVRDFGDCMVGTSQVGIHIIADRRLDDTGDRWLSPEYEHEPPELNVRSRAGNWLRWAMPGMVNRGDFVLSDSDPSHFLCRSELLQMRDIDPVPTLQWERLSPLPWDGRVAFSPDWVAVWNIGEVYVLEAATGRSVWEDRPLVRLGRPISRVLILGKEVRVLLGAGKDRGTVPLYVSFDGRSGRDIVPSTGVDALWSERPDTGRRVIPDGPERLIEAHADGYRYEFRDNRLRAIDLWDTREQWGSPTIIDDVRFIAPLSGGVLALTQARLEGHIRFRDMAHIQVFDRHDGERINAFRLFKRWQHQFEHCDDRVMIWDINFLYCVQPPIAAAHGGEQVTIRQSRPDPDAIAALRLARDLETPPQVSIGTLQRPPHVDAEFSEWSTVEPVELRDVMDWRPDFVHRSRWKSRFYGGGDDLSAKVRLAWAGDSLCIAADVTDDAHVTTACPGLWRFDSITLQISEGGSEDVDPLMLTVGSVNGIVRLEMSSPVMMLAASDPPGTERHCEPGIRRFALSRPGAAGAGGPEATLYVEAAVQRDDFSRRTRYEIAMPRQLLRYGPESYWDLLINDNDGQGREGALQLASSIWSIEESQAACLRGGR
ncbi:MAG TPA: PQQ-binding-like beta-propeller repeat protein [Phycisphaerae bacterium]|nr:PQQ-binding-like beta-propeller repeat protein [Phycisphaerae bacterium]HRR83568.1 PQQ-binding-like beta-propeller repeat protein [Phycisphaerae bacterium]